MFPVFEWSNKLYPVFLLDKQTINNTETITFKNFFEIGCPVVMRWVIWYKTVRICLLVQLWPDQESSETYLPSGPILQKTQSGIQFWLSLTLENARLRKG